MTDEQIAAANFLYGEPQVTREQLIERLREAEAENTELKKVLEAQCVAAINDRIAALEEAAAQAYVKLGETVGRWEIQEVRKCLAKVLARGPKNGD